MNVLDMLQAYLRQNAGFEQEGDGPGDPLQPRNALDELLQRQMGRGEPPPTDPILPSYLPDAVRRSILTQPSYAEGQRMPQLRNPAIDQEFGATLDPRREDDLVAALGRGRSNQGSVMPDGIPDAWLKRNSYGYPSPLNSMMGRYPLALY